MVRERALEHREPVRPVVVGPEELMTMSETNVAIACSTGRPVLSNHAKAGVDHRRPDAACSGQQPPAKVPSWAAVYGPSSLVLVDQPSGERWQPSVARGRRSPRPSVVIRQHPTPVRAESETRGFHVQLP